MNPAGQSVDVFISYGHIDNSDGWVTALHSRLEKRTSQILGRPVKFWRDLKLDGSDALWEVLEEHVSHALLLLSVLSPRYLTSDACRREVECFRAAVASSGLQVGHAFRIIRVVKTPYNTQSLPESLRDIDTTGFHFFEYRDQDETRFTEFPANDKLQGYDKFYQLSEDLAQSICGILQKLEVPSSNSARTRVFIAEVTSDRASDRTFLVNELKKKYDLAPADRLPSSLDELQQSVAEELKTCVLSVHMLGARFGLVPEGEENRSLSQIQFEQAAARHRLVWIPEDLTGIELRQQRFFESLDSIKDPNLEVVRAGKQAFVLHVLDVLRQSEEMSDAPAYGKAVYLVSSQEDLSRDHFKELRKCILDRGFRVEQPVYEGDIEELSRAEREALRDTNATLIFYGAARDTWVYNRRKEIVKALATLEIGRKHNRALYLAEPETNAKRGVYMDLPGSVLPEAGGFPPLLILGDCAVFSCAKLEPLLRSLAQDRTQ